MARARVASARRPVLANTFLSREVMNAREGSSAPIRRHAWGEARLYGAETWTRRPPWR
jgi:hypothetical protein